MRTISLTLTLLCLATLSTPASAYIGEGIQGRPHGGRTVVRDLYRRHGLPVPMRYRRHHHPHYNY